MAIGLHTAKGYAMNTTTETTGAEQTKISLYEMAMSGMNPDDIKCRTLDIVKILLGMKYENVNEEQRAEQDRVGWQLVGCICRGRHVMASVEMHGVDRGVRSINEAKCLRLMLAYCFGWFDDLDESPAISDGFTKLEIAEMRCGIRGDDVQVKAEWK
ncbi:hypothetical protein COB72_01870 [bacterium]|nr:MAG: hypothetical protein COB72_01870 [bacterium]